MCVCGGGEGVSERGNQVRGSVFVSPLLALSSSVSTILLHPFPFVIDVDVGKTQANNSLLAAGSSGAEPCRAPRPQRGPRRRGCVQRRRRRRRRRRQRRSELRLFCRRRQWRCLLFSLLCRHENRIHLPPPNARPRRRSCLRRILPCSRLGATP